MTRKIAIFDTTLRDGEQLPGASMNTEEKLIIARQLVRMNVDVIEGASPSRARASRPRIEGDLGLRGLLALVLLALVPREKKTGVRLA